MGDFDVPALWTAIFAALIWQLGVFAPLDILGSYGEKIGQMAVLAGAGLSTVATGMLLMKRAQVPLAEMSSVLVTSGPYSWSRNPAYLGDGLILLGMMFWCDALWTLPLLAAYFYLIERRFVLAEEAKLGFNTGRAYSDWAARTPRWMPGLPSGKGAAR